jgi:hypothetical protein
MQGKFRLQTQVCLIPWSIDLASTDCPALPLMDEEGTEPNTSGGREVEEQKLPNSQHLRDSDEFLFF